MIARVLFKRDHPGPAFAISAVSALALAAIAVDDFTNAHVIPVPPGTGAYTLVTILFLILALAPWVTPARRARPARVTTEEGTVRIDQKVIRASEVTAFSVARGLRGLSIAIQRNKEVVFVEVDRDEDAVRIARALGRDASKPDAVAPEGSSRPLALIQANATFLLLVLAPLYWVSAMGEGNYKSTAGIGALVAAFSAMAIFLVRRLVTSCDMKAFRFGAWARHAALHWANVAPALAPRETGTPLKRGEEPVSAWLERLDALPVNEGAYRALPRDVLLDVLASDEASPDERMGAARVLRRRYGAPASIVRVVADPEVRIRVEAAADGDVVEAEEKIERLGPLFRAR